MRLTRAGTSARLRPFSTHSSTSKTKYYRALIEGTLGALWPATLPSYCDGSVNARLGDLFNFSKIYSLEAAQRAMRGEPFELRAGRFGEQPVGREAIDQSFLRQGLDCTAG